ncbi:CMRF35-like molecule 1 isoform X2 [Ictalurus punctatus]|uniref:CMRF35-like molecule 1 isoform X2 n=1 Tax=Ictalurus punctatus TaxID=7998 RepID=A0A2D0Q4K2_ICTPU|nr:CMRF35-like molecule 1 isoform X2 [Ictalurus punctatus]
MKLLLGVICVLLSARSFVISGIKMNGYEGQSITIECSHVWANGNRKYFCKDPCKEEKDVVADSVKPLHVRYQVQDRGNVFTVTITDLKKTDSGKYWCAVDRMLGDTYTEVSLTVLEVLPSSPSLSTRTHIYSPSTISYLGSTSITPNATYTTETSVMLRCCPGRPKASDSEGNSFEIQNSISHNPCPASTHTPPEYENVLNITSTLPTYNIYTVQ